MENYFRFQVKNSNLNQDSNLYLQISSLALYHQSYPGSIEGYRSNLSLLTAILWKTRQLKWKSARLELWRSKVRILVQDWIFLLKYKIAISQGTNYVCIYLLMKKTNGEFLTLTEILVMKRVNVHEHTKYGTTW